MAYKNGNREQIELLPPSIEEYVSKEDPVRAYDSFVEALDFKELGININENKVGNSEYNPKAMLKLLVYGYSYGIRSSRKIERATYHNISFIWLVEGLKPDHKTIAEFRRKNKESLKIGLKMCAQLCLKFNLIEGNIMFVDGSKVRANAGKEHNHNYEWYKEQLEKLDKRIEFLIEECETIDEKESKQESLVKMNEELAKAVKSKEKIEEAIKGFRNVSTKTKNGKERTINMTDPESGFMKSRQGTHASYNIQSVIDDKNGLIVHMGTVREATDFNQFAKQITEAEETLGKKCKVACADAGYADTEELKKIDERGIKVIVPSQRQALHKPEEKFSKNNFKYDKKENCYYCPEGNKLEYKGKQEEEKKLKYLISDAKICHSCKHYGICTTSKNGRNIVRLIDEEIKEKIEEQYKEAENQEIYKRRKERVEHPFGHIKRNLGISNFLLRGIKGAQAEISISATCFNIVRMIKILGGVEKFIVRLSTTG